MSPMAPPMMNMMNQSMGNMAPMSQFVNQGAMPTQQQQQQSQMPTLAELEAFVQTRRQQEQEQLGK